MRRRHLFLKSIFSIGIVFLFFPLLSMMVYSFNASRLAAIWGGFSTKWYANLLANVQIQNAALLSLEVGIVSATLATILGTAAAIVLTRFGLFIGRSGFTAMVTAPLVMPEVISGVALLLVFILSGHLLGWPTQRGFLTLVIAHATFSTAFVTMVVQAPLRSMDRACEEAGLDLGSRHWQVLLDITLPQCIPAILAGWLMAFTMSLDNVVTSTFVTGPGATTLPLLIWSKLRMGISPDINALATLIIVSVALLMGTFMLLANLQKTRSGLR